MSESDAPARFKTAGTEGAAKAQESTTEGQQVALSRPSHDSGISVSQPAAVLAQAARQAMLVERNNRESTETESSDARSVSANDQEADRDAHYDANSHQSDDRRTDLRTRDHYSRHEVYAQLEATAGQDHD